MLPESASMFKLAGNQCKEGLEVMRRCARLLNWIDLVTCLHHFSCLCVGFASVPEVLERLRLELPQLESQGPKSCRTKKNIWLYWQLLASIFAFLVHRVLCGQCSFCKGSSVFLPQPRGFFRSQCGWAQLFWETWQLTTAHRVAVCSFQGLGSHAFGFFRWIMIMPSTSSKDGNHVMERLFLSAAFWIRVGLLSSQQSPVMFT